MLFHSFDFFIFLTIITLAFYTIPERFRWLLLLLASYTFYISWNPFYVVILIALSSVAYVTGVWLNRKDLNRQLLLRGSILVQLLPLLFYKYLNFFIEFLNDIFGLVHVPIELYGHAFIFPLGLSFFTFQTISYSVDVYRGYIKPERHFGYLALYTSFFPQLLAGPIERAKKLIPQLSHTRPFDYALFVQGCQLILWGLFKKLVISERLSLYVSEVFDHPTEYQGLTVWIACFFFILQIYTDFSAYTDIARGSARWLGIKLSFNFGNRVYFKSSITAFWKEWHITLTSWFRDYVFFPMSKIGITKRHLFINLIFVYILTGFWHGATWGFLIWGALNGVWVAYEQLTKKKRLAIYERLGLTNYPLLLHTLNVMIILVLSSMTALWFRAANVTEAWLIFKSLFHTNFSIDVSIVNLNLLFVLLLFMDVINYRFQKKEIFDWLSQLPRVVRWVFYVVVIELIIQLGISGAAEFYYFRF